MDATILNRARRLLTPCGAVKPFKGNMVLAWPPKAFPLAMSLAAGQTTTFNLEITGETEWELSAISSLLGMATVSGTSQTINARMNILLPNGRYLFGGNGIDAASFG